jgi:hypothetical protein
VLDALMNIGPEQTMELVAKGTQKWLTWDEMVTRKRELLQERARGEEAL